MGNNEEKLDQHLAEVNLCKGKKPWQVRVGNMEMNERFLDRILLR